MVSTVVVSNSNRVAYSSNVEMLHYILPRLEVQFICEHEIRPQFNVTDTFASFFQQIINQYFNLYMDSLHDHVENYTNAHNIISNLTFVEKEDMKLYSSISVSDMNDVGSQRWYYPLCNSSSPDVLASMDVRGYLSVPSNILFKASAKNTKPGKFHHVHNDKENQENKHKHEHPIKSYHDYQHPYSNENKNNNEDHHPHHRILPETTDGDDDGNQKNIHAAMNTINQYLIDNVDQPILREYFSNHVCPNGDLIFFRSKLVEWDDLSFPMPSSHNGSVDLEYQETSPYDDSNVEGAVNQDSHHHFFDHDLYLLCTGAEDLVALQSSEDEPVNGTFLALGIFVGMVMISMIGKELRKCGSSSSSARQRSQPNQGYERTAAQEVEMVWRRDQVLSKDKGDLHRCKSSTINATTRGQR